MITPLLIAEINLGAIAHNVREFRRLAAPNVKIMTVVKANGYGHGAVEVSKTTLANGADTLGVARLEEALALRKSGIDAPILIFGYILPRDTTTLLDYDLTATIFDPKSAEVISSSAKSLGKKINAHLKIDTGMGRLGILTPKGQPGYDGGHTIDIKDVIKIIKKPGLEIEGIYTHFSTTDQKDKTFAKKQFDIFIDFIYQLKKKGIHIPVKHLANSAAAIEMPQTHFDMIRPGISCYGLYPSNESNRKLIDLKPAMSLKSKIISLKKVMPGFKVSYGHTHITTKKTVIAVVPVGYADGFNRHFSSNGHMLVNGERAPIVGRVCMDLTMIDVGHIPNVRLEDEVVIFGSQQSESISADELAENAGTINYEIVSALTNRVQRIYT